MHAEMSFTNVYQPVVPMRSLPRALVPKPLILCVEDEEPQLRLRTMVLEREGYCVLGAATAEEALETFREAPVCLVLADHMLRGKTGLWLAGEMKKEKPDVPIVLYSGHQPESLRHVDCFISKGEPLAAFLSVIRGVLRRYFGVAA